MPPWADLSKTEGFNAEGFNCDGVDRDGVARVAISSESSSEGEGA